MCPATPMPSVAVLPGTVTWVLSAASQSHAQAPSPLVPPPGSLARREAAFSDPSPASKGLFEEAGLLLGRAGCAHVCWCV